MWNREARFPGSGVLFAMFTLALCALTLAGQSAMVDSAGRSPTVTADTGAYAAQDTVRPRRRAIDVSDWYYRRLTIHRWGSYAVLPLFGFQYVAGTQLYDRSSSAPTWAITGHRIGATALAGLFTVNTVTGLWNLWDSRAVEERRWLRYAHALSMLTADAAFTWAGSSLQRQAETSLARRREHRTVALGAMGLTVGSGLMMRIWNR